uniref:Uncharacterized protein n=1 Tax=Anguilla anguilla TaxID=7936 RepID=A0A0E9PL22_ANGAN
MVYTSSVRRSVHNATMTVQFCWRLQCTRGSPPREIEKAEVQSNTALRIPTPPG